MQPFYFVLNTCKSIGCAPKLETISSIAHVCEVVGPKILTDGLVLDVRQLMRNKVEEYAISNIAVRPKAIAKTIHTEFKGIYPAKMLEVFTEEQMTKWSSA